MREQLYWNDIPVPYVALWSSETYSHIAEDRNSGDRDAIFTNGARGEGQPVWGKMNEPRQRETVYLRRCQVCNCKLKGERSFGMDVPQYMQHEGYRVPVLMEPPACARCTLYAMDNCPGTQRRAERGDLRCYEIRDYVAICQILGHVEGGTPELNAVLLPDQVCVGMNKCVLQDYRLLSFSQLRVEVSR